MAYRTRSNHIESHLEFSAAVLWRRGICCTLAKSYSTQSDPVVFHLVQARQTMIGAALDETSAASVTLLRCYDATRQDPSRQIQTRPVSSDRDPSGLDILKIGATSHRVPILSGRT